jgi:hypothetical protein
MLFIDRLSVMTPSRSVIRQQRSRRIRLGNGSEPAASALAPCQIVDHRILIRVGVADHASPYPMISNGNRIRYHSNAYIH